MKETSHLRRQMSDVALMSVFIEIFEPQYFDLSHSSIFFQLHRWRHYVDVQNRLFER